MITFPHPVENDHLLVTIPADDSFGIKRVYEDFTLKLEYRHFQALCVFQETVGRRKAILCAMTRFIEIGDPWVVTQGNAHLITSSYLRGLIGFIQNGKSFFLLLVNIPVHVQ